MVKRYGAYVKVPRDLVVGEPDLVKHLGGLILEKLVKDGVCKIYENDINPFDTEITYSVALNVIVGE